MSAPAGCWNSRAERARTAAGRLWRGFLARRHGLLNPVSATDGLRRPRRSLPNRRPNLTPSALPPWWALLAPQQPERRLHPRDRPYPSCPNRPPTSPPDVARQPSADPLAMRHREPESLSFLIPPSNRLRMQTRAAPLPARATIRPAQPVRPASMQPCPRSASVSGLASVIASALAAASGAAALRRTSAAPAPPARPGCASSLRRRASSPRRHAPLPPWAPLHQLRQCQRPHRGHSPAAARRSGAHNAQCFWAPSYWWTAIRAMANRHRRCDGGALPRRVWRGRATGRGRMHHRPIRRRRASGSRSARAS